MSLERNAYLDLVEKTQAGAYQYYINKGLEGDPDFVKKRIERSPGLQERYRSLAFAAHQIRQPVTVIRGYVEGMPYMLGIHESVEKSHELLVSMTVAINLLRDQDFKQKLVFEDPASLNFLLASINGLAVSREDIIQEEGFLTYERAILGYFDFLKLNVDRLKTVWEEEDEDATRERFFRTLRTRLRFYSAYITGKEIQLVMEDLDGGQLENLIKGCLGASEIGVLDLGGVEERIAMGADRFLLAEVISNVLVNADRYKRPGDKRGKVEVETIESPDGWATIALTDFGIGIPAGEEEIIFEFGRKGSNVVHNADEDVRDTGEGLGLYFAREMVRVMGGEMWASSKGEGQGSTFYIRLPSVTNT